MKKFSDFAEENPQLDGPKISIDEVVNREIFYHGPQLKNILERNGSQKT